MFYVIWDWVSCNDEHDESGMEPCKTLEEAIECIETEHYAAFMEGAVTVIAGEVYSLDKDALKDRTPKPKRESYTPRTEMDKLIHETLREFGDKAIEAVIEAEQKHAAMRSLMSKIEDRVREVTGRTTP